MLHVIFALVLSEMVREWRIISAAYMHLNNCFKCKVCTNKSDSLADLEIHILCNHAWKSEIFPKASFGISNDLGCVFCISILWIEVRMKIHIHCFHASKTGYTQRQLWYFNGWNIKSSTLNRCAFLPLFFKEVGWWIFKQFKNKPNSAQRIILL